ncbi:Peroxin-3-domain-containing protein [Pisolithus croceorrhizus]|nr:Peroxin-3-domain-containing protein [Pisolithus croceorrhizus]
MFDSLQRYVYDRRRGLLDTVMTMGTAYAAGAYLRERFEEVKLNVMRQRVARERSAKLFRLCLRRRFQSTHDDTCFTIMALIPTLAAQILEEMDVESLTNELQSLSASSSARSPSQLLPSQAHDVQSVAEASSISDAQSEASSMSLSSYSGSGYDVERASGVGSASWVEHMSASGTSQASHASLSRPESQLSDSILSTGSSLSHDTSHSLSSANSPSPSTKKRKAQLWKEVKNLTLTRALTTLYTTTLLSLLTAAQLSIIARSRYIASVRASERAERVHERIPHFSLTGILAREAIARVVDVEALCPEWVTKDDDLDSEENADDISEGTEARYLTLSWWILHVGWKDVAERVRGAVESVFESVSLRNKLSCSELHALILDVRRHVELDGAAGRPHSRFYSCLLPPTPETTAHVLAQGGAPLVLPPPSQRDHVTVRGKRREIDPFDPVVVQDGFSAETAIDITSPKRRAVNLPPHDHKLSSDTLPIPAHSPLPPSLPVESRPFPSAEARQEAVLLSSLRSDPRFVSLLDETRAYLSGPDFAYALTCALDRATSVLIDHLHKRIFVDTGSALAPAEENTNDHPDKGGREDPEGSTVVDAKEELKIRLVGLLPGLARWSQLALNATPNELVDNIMAVREVSALEAIVISDYQDRYPPIS